MAVIAEPIRAELLPAGYDQPSRAELGAMAFLAGHSGETLKAYRRDLTSFFAYCAEMDMDPLSAQRTHIELFARWLEKLGRAQSTVANRMSTVCCWYRYLSIEDYIPKDVAAHVRRPKRPQDSSNLGMDRMETSSFLAAASRARPVDNALACLLVLNGLRASEACNADIENMGMERGHRTLHIIGKGSKPALIALSPRTARTLVIAIGERTSGPILLARSGGRLKRHDAIRIVRRLAKAAGVSHNVTPHSCRHAAITASLDAGVPLRDVAEFARHADPRTTIRYDRARHSLDRHATYVLTAYLAGGA